MRCEHGNEDGTCEYLCQSNRNQTIADLRAQLAAANERADDLQCMLDHEVGQVASLEAEFRDALYTAGKKEAQRNIAEADRDAERARADAAEQRALDWQKHFAEAEGLAGRLAKSLAAAEHEREEWRERHAVAVDDLAALGKDRDREHVARVKAEGACAALRRVLLRTCSWADNPLPDHPGVSAEWREHVAEVRTALVTDAGQSLLNELHAARARVSTLMPDYDDIPEEFRRNRSPWCAIADAWFFHGLNSDRVEPNEDIDKERALAHLGAILNSMEPAHEHKIAAVAYLMSLWFKAPSGGAPRAR